MVTTRRHERASLPLPGCQAQELPAPELQALHAEVLRLRSEEKRSAELREELGCQVEHLKTELQRALDENRNLKDLLGNQENKIMVPVSEVKGVKEGRLRGVHEATTLDEDETAARESALENARELFKSMLSAEDSSPGCVAASKQNIRGCTRTAPCGPHILTEARHARHPAAPNKCI